MQLFEKLESHAPQNKNKIEKRMKIQLKYDEFR